MALPEAVVVADVGAGEAAGADEEAASTPEVGAVWPGSADGGESE